MGVREYAVDQVRSGQVRLLSQAKLSKGLRMCMQISAKRERKGGEREEMRLSSVVCRLSAVSVFYARGMWV